MYYLSLNPVTEIGSIVLYKQNWICKWFWTLLQLLSRRKCQWNQFFAAGQIFTLSWFDGSFVLRWELHQVVGRDLQLVISILHFSKNTQRRWKKNLFFFNKQRPMTSRSLIRALFILQISVWAPKTMRTYHSMYAWLTADDWSKNEKMVIKRNIQEKLGLPLQRNWTNLILICYLRNDGGFVKIHH